MKSTKTLSFTFPENKYNTMLAICTYALRRKPSDEEVLLIYMIKKSVDGFYDAGSGKRTAAIRECNLTPSRYRRAFNLLVSTKTIIKKKNSAGNNFCYYGFCDTIKRALKGLEVK